MESDDVIKTFRVISPDYIKNLYLENQHPQVASLFYLEPDQFDWDVITELDLSCSQIAHIGGLRLVRNLNELRMANNSIRKIENLQGLTRLTKLDLSHNLIAKIENLERLTELKNLRLCYNRIEKLENLDANALLESLDVSHNAISDVDEFVLYASRLNCLRSLGVAYNPATCSAAKYRPMIKDWLPRLQLLDGAWVVDEERLLKVSSGSLKTIVDDSKTRPDDRLPVFLTDTDGVPFLAHLFHDDKPGKILSKWNSTVRMAFDTYCEDMIKGAVKFHTTVLERLKVRKKLSLEFKKNYYLFERKWTERSRDMISDFEEIKRMRMCNLGDSSKFPSMATSLYIECFEEAAVTLTDKLHKTNIEMNRSIDMMINKYEQILQDEIKSFIDILVPIFFNLRQVENDYSQVLTENVKLVVSNIQKMIPKEISNNFENRYAMVQAAFESTDKHMDIIYKREEKIQSDINNWMKNIIDELKKQESKRFWMVIEEIRKYHEVYYSWLETLKN